MLMSLTLPKVAEAARPTMAPSMAVINIGTNVQRPINPMRTARPMRMTDAIVNP